MQIKDFIKKCPKVELHDHLDGGLRPQTIIELADKYKVDIPSHSPDELAAWFERGCKLKSLPLYLETFAVTNAVMQTEEALERVAYEAVLDWHKENIVYGEIRFAPVLHTQQGLSLHQIVSAVLEGMDRGKKETGVCFGLILCAMRNQDPAISLEIAQLAVAYRSKGVVALDLAGDENGYPPKAHIEAFQYCKNKNFNITIHAGEAFGVESIWQAIQVCGAHRIGHGTRLIDDMTVYDGKIYEMGDLAHYVLDKRIPLEMCITSNVGTGAADNPETHPFGFFFRNQFRVFLCTDNRLMSNTTLTKELEIAQQAFNLTEAEIEKITTNAMKSSFTHHDEILRIIYNVIKPQFAALASDRS